MSRSIYHRRAREFQELLDEHGHDRLQVEPGLCGREYIHFSSDGYEYIAYEDGEIEELTD